MPGYFITGTDTGVGKTFVTALLAALLQKEEGAVGVYKPIESGGPLVNNRFISADMEFVKKKAQLAQALSEMNTYSFPEPVAPHLAAKLSQKKIELKVILAHYQKLQQKYSRVLVEGAGGICVPITDTGIMIAELIKLLSLPVIVVARPNLGTINHTVLTVNYAQSKGLTVKGIIINYTEPTEQTLVEKSNPAFLEQLTGLPVLGIVPYMQSGDLPNPAACLNTKELLRGSK